MEPKDEQTFQNRVDLSQLAECVAQIRKNIGEWIVGQERMIDLIITALLADGHVLLEGVPGVAKTLTAKLVAKTVSVDFSRIQFTPDLMPSDIIGAETIDKDRNFRFIKGPIFANIILADEINRTPP